MGREKDIMGKKPLVTADDSVEELVERYPEMIGILMRKGIVCVKCGEPYWGKLGELIADKGLPVEETVSALNAELSGN